MQSGDFNVKLNRPGRNNYLIRTKHGIVTGYVAPRLSRQVRSALSAEPAEPVLHRCQQFVKQASAHTYEKKYHAQDDSYSKGYSSRVHDLSPVGSALDTPPSQLFERLSLNYFETR